MDELSRIEVAAQLLEEIGVLCAHQDLNRKYNIIYNFLLSDAATSDYDDTLCSNHGLELKLLNTYKKDAWLLILIDAYEYLTSLSEERELTEEEQCLLTKLDALEFNFTNLYYFFTSSANRGDILIALKSYYEYWQKGNDFVKQHRDYNYENQTMFRNRLTAYIGNIEAMDLMATIFDDLDTKYQKEINMAIVGEEESIEFEEPDMDDYELESGEEFPEDFDEDEYSAAVDEMFDDNEEEVEKIMERFKTELHSKILDFLEDYLDDKFDCDEFLGFFMSYVYMIILNNQKHGKLFKEEEQLLKVLSLEDFSPALVIETFYENPDYVFAALDTFCRYYYKHECDILTIRDSVDNPIVKQRINMLDEYFPSDKRIEKVQLLSNPFYEIYDMLYLQIKSNNPTDYVEKLYLSLVTQEVNSAFYEFDLDDDINYHRVMMIRYFSRKFIEAVSSEEMKATSTNEYAAFEMLLSDDLDQKTFLNAFMRYGISILKGYEKILGKTISEEKLAIKNLFASGLGNKIFRIDPGMLSDSLYYRALNDTPLFKYVEQHGIEQTIKYLIGLAQDDYAQYEDYMKEVIAAIYCHLKDVPQLDSTEYVVKSLIDSENDNLDNYFKVLVQNESLMHCLLSKYYEIETMEDYPKPIEDRIVEQPKVKQKLYPIMNEDNRDS